MLTREEYFEIIKKNYGFKLDNEEVMSEDEYKNLTQFGTENKTFKQKSLMLAFKYVTHFYIEKSLNSQTFEDALQTTYLLMNDFLKTSHATPKRYLTYKRYLAKYLEESFNMLHENNKKHNQDLNFSHIVAPDKANNPEIDELADKEINNKSLRAGLLKGMKNLTGTEQYVLKLRYGLDGKGAKTFASIGRENNLTLERIRQIEAKALVKMRHPENSRVYREFIK